MKEVGYARISTDKQQLDGQCAALLEVVLKEDIYTDTCSGTIEAMERPGFMSLMAAVKAGGVSTVVVYEFSRLGRNYADSVRTVLNLEDLNVTVRSLSPKEEYISTCPDKGMKRIMLTIALTSAERERELLVARTKNGLVTARAKIKQKWKEDQELPLTERKPPTIVATNEHGYSYLGKSEEPDLGRPKKPFSREFVEFEKARGQTHVQIAASLGMGITTL